MKNTIQLSDHMTYKKLLKFTLPSIAMMVFTSIYGIVDGLFISNFVGKTAFAAVNLVMPVLMMVGGLGFMMGTGGAALVAKTLGEKNEERANKIFSQIVYFTMILAVIASVILFLLISDIAVLLGASEEMLPYCVTYGKILICGNIFFMLQNLFQNFYMTAARPQYAFRTSLVAGVTNMIGDALLVGVFKFGVAGAAVATIASQAVGALIPFIYFARKNSTVLRLIKAKFEFKIIFQAMFNGSSELLSNISSSIVGIVYNKQLMSYAGENGVAAYGVIMYVSFIFVAVFIGYAIGTAGFVSYNYGASNNEELKNIRKRSYNINMVFGISMVIACFLLAKPFAYIYVSYDETLLEMTTTALRIYAISFLVTGCNIFTSSFFTALNNGLVSAIISMLRTLVFQVGSVLLLPIILGGVNGIWAAIIVAEAMSMIIGVTFLITNRKKYNY